MMKELCYRCSKPVYPTDKVGPLKDLTYFHHGCFKCYICGTRLVLKTYCNNRNNTDDRVISLMKMIFVRHRIFFLFSIFIFVKINSILFSITFCF